MKILQYFLSSEKTNKIISIKTDYYKTQAIKNYKIRITLN